MSGVLTSIGKVFTKVVSGLSTTLGSAVTGVGATVATAGAASGGGIASGALSAAAGGAAGGGILSKIFGGVAKVAGFGKDALLGTTSATGAAVEGASAASAVGRGGMLGKIKDFVGTEAGASLVAGLGKGLGSFAEAKMEQQEKQKDRQFLLDKEQRLRDSYEMPTSALPDGASTGVVNDPTKRPTPTQSYARTEYVYDANLGRMVKVPV